MEYIIYDAVIIVLNFNNVLGLREISILFLAAKFKKS